MLLMRCRRSMSTRQAVEEDARQGVAGDLGEGRVGFAARALLHFVHAAGANHQDAFGAQVDGRAKWAPADASSRRRNIRG